MNLDVEYVKYSIFQLRILRKVLIAVSLILFSISFAISFFVFRGLTLLGCKYFGLANKSIL
jgi:hypothetical protein